MDNIFDRLRHLVDVHAGGNASKFAKTIDINAGTFNNYLNGRNPNVECLNNICRTLNVNLNWLVAGIGLEHMTKSNLSGSPDILPDELNIEYLKKIIDGIDQAETEEGKKMDPLEKVKAIKEIYWAMSKKGGFKDGSVAWLIRGHLMLRDKERGID